MLFFFCYFLLLIVIQGTNQVSFKIRLSNLEIFAILAGGIYQVKSALHSTYAQIIMMLLDFYEIHYQMNDDNKKKV